jgi:hypothetical protein
MLAYLLNKNLDGQKLLQDIQNLINKTTSAKDRILIVQIKEIDQDSTAHIPKIEHKQT